MNEICVSKEAEISKQFLSREVSQRHLFFLLENLWNLDGFSRVFIGFFWDFIVLFVYRLLDFERFLMSVFECFCASKTIGEMDNKLSNFNFLLLVPTIRDSDENIRQKSIIFIRIQIGDFLKYEMRKLGHICYREMFT